MPNGMTEDAVTAISSLRTLLEDLRAQVSAPIEWPLPATRLGLEARASEPSRMFKHIQQMCLLHTSSFQHLNQIKLVYLLEAYLAVVDARTPLGIYSAARSVLKFSAFTFDVARRLSAVRDSQTRHWREKGEGFFGIIIRAAFGTSDPKAADLLLAEGTPKEYTRPFRIGDSIKALGLAEGFDDILAHYNMLCDFVHHNFSSGTITATSIRHGTAAHSFGGGMLVLTKPGPIVCRRYPAPEQAAFAVNQTAAVALRNATAAVRWTNESPESPFTPDEVRKMTGYEFGMAELRSPNLAHARTEQTVNHLKPGRNDPCPCGSGKKYKRCCISKT